MSYGIATYIERVVYPGGGHSGSSFGQPVNAGYLHVHFLFHLLHQLYRAEGTCHDTRTEAGHVEHTEVKVIDPETGEECPVGVQGEMCNRGYNTMKGYYKNPEATAEVIDENGFLHSGDLGIKDEDGNYRITGRIKDMIIRGGENIYPREIEEFLYQLEGVKDVQVAGIPSKKYGEAVGAFIILHEGVDMHESDVRDFCIGKISRYKIPKYIFFIKEFPMTGSGKIQKFKLKDLGLQLCKEQGIEIV